MYIRSLNTGDECFSKLPWDISLLKFPNDNDIPTTKTSIDFLMSRCTASVCHSITVWLPKVFYWLIPANWFLQSVFHAVHYIWLLLFIKSFWTCHWRYSNYTRISSLLKCFKWASWRVGKEGTFWRYFIHHCCWWWRNQYQLANTENTPVSITPMSKITEHPQLTEWLYSVPFPSPWNFLSWQQDNGGGSIVQKLKGFVLHLCFLDNNGYKSPKSDSVINPSMEGCDNFWIGLNDDVLQKICSVKKPVSIFNDRIIQYVMPYWGQKGDIWIITTITVFLVSCCSKFFIMATKQNLNLMKSNNVLLPSGIIINCFKMWHSAIQKEATTYLQLLGWWSL